MNSGTAFEANNLAQFDQGIALIRKDVEKGGYFYAAYRLVKPRQSTVPMIKTWRKWMAETAGHMAANGVTMPLYIKSDGEHIGSRPFGADDAHELFLRTYLGVDKDGERFKTRRGLTPQGAEEQRGKMLFAMDSHIAFCLERGIRITIPNDDEYAKLKREAV